MPTINVQMFEGRSVEQKRAFVKAVTEAAVTNLKCSADSVDIIISEFKPENERWSYEAAVVVLVLATSVEKVDMVEAGVGNVD